MEVVDKVVPRKWDGVPSWLKTYFVALDGYGNWYRGETMEEAKDGLLKMAKSKTHGHFSKYGLVVWMIRQDEKCDAPFVTVHGGLCHYADPFNGDASIIEIVKAKR